MCISEFSLLLDDHGMFQSMRVLKRIHLRLFDVAKARESGKGASATETLLIKDATCPCTAAQITVLRVLRPVEGEFVEYI